MKKLAINPRESEFQDAKRELFRAAVKYAARGGPVSEAQLLYYAREYGSVATGYYAVQRELA